MMLLLLVITEANASSAYPQNTYASANLGIHMGALNVSLNGSFADNIYHHGTANVNLRLCKEISLNVNYRKDDESGRLSKSFGVYYDIYL